MALRPGWKTTEAWLTLLVVAMLQWAVLTGHVNGELGEVTTAAISAYYTYARKDHKSDLLDQAIQAAQVIAPHADNLSDAEHAALQYLVENRGGIMSAVAHAAAEAGGAK